MERNKKIVLTDSEWMELINAERHGLPRCCANVSALRDCIINIAREDGNIYPFHKDIFEQHFNWVFYEGAHALEDFEGSPIFKIAIQLNIDIQSVSQGKHKPQKHKI